MKNVEKFTRNDFPILGHSALIYTALKRSHELIPILLDHESHELLSIQQSGAMSQQRSKGSNNGTRTHLSNIQIGLHDQEWVEGIGTRGIRVVKEILDFRERRLSEARTSIFRGDVRLRMSLFETEWLRGMCERSDDPRVKCLYFLESCGEELTLRRRTLVHPDAHQNLAKQGEYS